MAEALVKTIKRDYVFCNDRPDAKIVMDNLQIGLRTITKRPTQGSADALAPRVYSFIAKFGVSGLMGATPCTCNLIAADF